MTKRQIELNHLMVIQGKLIVENKRPGKIVRKVLK